MTVFVDDFRVSAVVRGMRRRWSHLLADSDEELLEFAKRIGLDPAWIQHPGEPHCHFDVTDAMRVKAIAAGAEQITYRESGALVGVKRERMRAEAAAEAPAPVQHPAEVVIVCGRGKPPPRYNPQLQRHSWHPRDEATGLHRCRFCGLAYRSEPSGKGWIKEWTLPNGTNGQTTVDGKLPKCPGRVTNPDQVGKSELPLTL